MRDRHFALLLGAGASYGAWSDSPSRPPLGGSLFDALVATFPQSWGSLSDEQRAAFDGDEPGDAFEDGMTRLWQGHLFGAVSGQDLLTDMALFFAQFRLPSERPNCYSDLVSAFSESGLIGPRLGVATLNYECLLEYAVGSLGISVDVRPVPPHPGALVIWKPHGACNLVLPGVANGSLRGIRMAATQFFVAGWSPATGVMTTGGPDLVTISPDQVAAIYQAGPNIPPAMSLYARGKHSPAAPGFIIAFRERWTNWTRESDVVIVIGARCAPADQRISDPHVWAGITEGTSDVWYVGDGASANALRAAVGEERLSHLGEYFDRTMPHLTRRIQLLA